jgi:uncharacterized protein (TIGR03083 family)
MKPLAPIFVVPLFPEERAALIEVLRSLSAEQWEAPTACEGWSVGDVARHIFADDLGRLSGKRDQYSGGWQFNPTDSETFEADLLDFINSENEAWVRATRRLSPRIVIDLLEWTGSETQAFFETLNPHAMGLGVSWAGEDESENWFDLAREYTERWHHQAQIRQGAGVPIITEPRLFAPVLATFVRGVPHAFAGVEAEDGAHIRLRITGDAGGAWSLIRAEGGWRLVQPYEGETTASVEVDQDVAWRLFTKGMTPEQAKANARLDGDQALAEHVLRTVSIIA